MEKSEVVRILATARFKARSDTLKNWLEQNPILLSGEPGVVIGLNTAGDGLENPQEKIKIGDGITPWNNLLWWQGVKGEKGDNDKDYILTDADKTEIANLIDLSSISTVGKTTTEGGEIFNDYENNQALDIGAHAEGRGTTANKNAHAEGRNTQALGNVSHAEGNTTTATGDGGSHAEGLKSIANGISAHAEGNETLADADNSHSEGGGTQALAPCSHAEGEHTIARAIHSHAEGFYTEANGTAAHSEGYQTRANGSYSHASGAYSQAYGDMSHASGCETIAKQNYQFVVGKYNKNKEDTVFEGGYGESDVSRTNVFEVYKDGSITIGGVTITPNQLTKLLSLL